MADSLASSAHSGPSLESSRYSVEMEGRSQTTLGTSKDGEKKKKKKDSKEKLVKLDEYGNPIKKKKSKRKENEGSRVEQSPVATHKEPLSDRVRASDDSFVQKRTLTSLTLTTFSSNATKLSRILILWVTLMNGMPTPCRRRIANGMMTMTTIVA
jgi:hypothetical protein